VKPEQIKELREELILDQAEFGKLFGVSRVTISAWENGRAKPYFTNMRKLRDMYEKLLNKK
jgi:DNA-binding transcriptional regulator YiaG